MASRKIEVAITGDARSLERAFGRAGKSSDSFGRKIGRGAGKGLLGFAKVAGVASVAVGVGFAAAVRHGMKGLNEQAKVMAQTEATLKSTKNAAKITADEIRALNEEMERKTGVDADVIQVGSNLLLTFSKIRNEVGEGNDIFSQANQTALDMSTTFGTSMKSASLQLGKALQDPVRGITALRRSGISFTDAQQDQIKALVESGKVLEAQKLILGEVNTQVGGSAEAMGKTFPGQVQRAKRAFEQLTEALAAPFMDVFSSGLEGALNIFSDPAVQAGIAQFGQRVAAVLQRVVEWLRANWPQIKSIVLGVFNALQTYYNTIVIPVFRGVISIIGRAVSFIRDNMPQIQAAVQAAFDWIKTNVVPTVQSVARNVQRFVSLMTAIWKKHGDDIKAVVGPVFSTIKTIIGNALRIIKGVVELVLALIRGDWEKAFDALKDITRAAFNSLRAIVTLPLRILAAVVKILGREIVEALVAGFGAIKTRVRERFNAAKDAITEIAGTMRDTAFDLGKQIIEGILNGLGGLYNAVKDKLRQNLRNAISFVRDNLGSTVAQYTARTIGIQIPDGIIQGIEKRRGAMVAKLKGAVRLAVNAAAQEARSNLMGLTSSLAGMLGRLFESVSPQARRLAQLRAQIDADDEARTRKRLQDSIDQVKERADVEADFLERVQSAESRAASDRAKAEEKLADDLSKARSRAARAEAQAEFARAVREIEQAKNDDIMSATMDKNRRLAELDEQRKQAQQDMSDFERDLEVQNLERFIADRQTAYETDIANLTEQFNRGEITAEQFRDALNNLIGGQTGSELGAAFAGEFARQLEAVTQQIQALIGFGGGIAGPSVVSPGAVGAAAQLKAWEKRRDAYHAARVNFYKRKDSEKGGTVTAREKKLINAEMDAWRKSNPKPRAMADGGILRSAVLAGEAGPEAVLPLSSGRARRMLADALDGADKLRGDSGGNVVVHVTVNGNEFSAAEFARKLAPELRRQVSLIRSA
jgi:uncharacterized protein YqgV (UPF0045/DUF77 family)